MPFIRFISGRMNEKLTHSVNSNRNELYMAAGGETYRCGFGPIVQTGTRAMVGGERCDCPRNRDLGAGRKSFCNLCASGQGCTLVVIVQCSLLM